MNIAAGSRLGPYEITSRIGAGGMGEVWRATDTRLGRSVAIKVLPAEFAANDHWRLRFEREARAISSLNHPHICTLYDVGREGDADFIVMELLEGESLADRLARTPLPVAETLRVGAQIGDALDRAHRAGIVHRDLKPGNVMLTKSGAKLLDFGLAKSSANAPADPTASTAMATAAKPLTQEGTILGTFQYMAPEQLEGLEADPRTDIFALGALLYEMATGRRAFSGTSKTSLIASIVGSEPTPISQIQPLTPPAFEHVVEKCLAKDPEKRWQSAFDVAEELRWVSEAGSSAGVATKTLRRRKRREWLWWSAALLAAIAVAAYFALRKPVAPPRIETSIVPPEGVSFSYVAGAVSLSPDGRNLAFIGRSANGPPQVWVRSLASSAAHPLAGTDDAEFPRWSPDGKSIAFIQRVHLMRVGADGGAPETICEVGGRHAGLAWAPNGMLFWGDSGDLAAVPASGGKRQVVIPGGDQITTSPAILPDGKHLLFTRLRGSSEPDAVYVATLDLKQQKRVLDGVYSNAAYVAPGWILYSRDGDLRAQRFDLGKLEVSGDPIRLADHVQYDADTKSAFFTVSDDGTLVYAEGEGAGKTQLVWVGRDGKELGALAPPAMYYSPRMSHDGKRVGVDISDDQTAKGDIWMFDLVRNTSTRVTFDPVNESAPTFSPDDKQIAMLSEKLGSLDLFRRATSGAGMEEPLVTDTSFKIPLSISPDGRWLAFVSAERGKSQWDLLVVDLTTKAVKPLLNTPFNEWAASFSPDGKWIAYSSDETGKQEVYVQEFPESNGKIIVSRGGGRAPRWRGDGRELYYLSPDRKMMAVPITYAPQFDSGLPQPLFGNVDLRDLPVNAQYDVAADGSRFLLNRAVGEQGSRPLTIVQNWTAALENH
jgi:serine/threonine protein kinase